MATIKVKFVSNGGAVEYIDRPLEYKRSTHWVESETSNQSATNKEAPDGIRGIDTPDTRAFLKALEDFRQCLLDADLITFINTSSMYRTEGFNKNHNGIAGSSHCTGEAMDWVITKGGCKASCSAVPTRMAISAVWEAVCKLHGRVGYICWYTNGFHLDFKKGPTKFKVYDYRGTAKDW